jgi:LPXTG-motif cell wall-anchored protein
MHTRRSRWTTVLAMIGALILAGAIYEASRGPTEADAKVVNEQRQAADETAETPVGLRTPEMWEQQEAALRTDQDARAYAEDFTTALRAIVQMPDPAVFYQDVTLAKVSAYRGAGAVSVWEATYNVTVGSNETTFTTVYPAISRFGPGVTPADKPLAGLDGVYAFADLQFFDEQQRVAFLTYWKAKKLNNVHVVARLDQAFPGAPWYEDTAFRAQLLETGEKAGYAPSNLAYYFVDHQRAGTLIGYDAESRTWRQLKLAPYNYAKWYAERDAAAARVVAREQAAQVTQAKAASAAKGTKPAAKPAKSASTAKAAPAAAPSTTGGAAATGGTTTGGTAATAQPAEDQVQTGGTIPSTGTPWYNLLVVGAALLMFGAAGLAIRARRKHV